jgi:hypothetical protein
MWLSRDGPVEPLQLRTAGTLPTFEPPLFKAGASRNLYAFILSIAIQFCRRERSAAGNDLG